MSCLDETRFLWTSESHEEYLYQISCQLRILRKLVHGVRFKVPIVITGRVYELTVCDGLREKVSKVLRPMRCQDINECHLRCWSY